MPVLRGGGASCRGAKGRPQGNGGGRRGAIQERGWLPDFGALVKCVLKGVVLATELAVGATAIAEVEKRGLEDGAKAEADALSARAREKPARDRPVDPVRGASGRRGGGTDTGPPLKLNDVAEESTGLIDRTRGLEPEEEGVIAVDPLMRGGGGHVKVEKVLEEGRDGAVHQAPAVGSRRLPGPRRRPGAFKKLKGLGGGVLGKATANGVGR